MKNNKLPRLAIFVENTFIFFSQIMFLSVIFFFGFNLFCFSFMNQPPWISSLTAITGALLIILGSNLSSNDYP